MSKMLGRIGDSLLIRFGTYTCGVCAVSGTLKWDMATVMEYTLHQNHTLPTVF
jgi:isoaspartyl peptidase/L-asparaginase-like protein (Ntn-hydrolase superfamily)